MINIQTVNRAVLAVTNIHQKPLIILNGHIVYLDIVKMNNALIKRYKITCAI